MNITITSAAEEIPHIINGVSANTMYYFINYEKVSKLKEINNTSCCNIPFDLDDFSRCVLAANAFNYTEVDIREGIKNIVALNGPKKFSYLFKHFLEMKKEYECKNYDKVRNFIKALREIR